LVGDDLDIARDIAAPGMNLDNRSAYDHQGDPVGPCLATREGAELEGQESGTGV
jgi:hypothetical protein